MRYAIFTDVHANLEALKAVLTKIDEIAQQEPIDQIWFLGDLVGYGPNPNECIETLRERTDVIIAGNHDWAAVGKIDLEDFSEAARISAEWTATQLTDEHREFLINLPEHIEQEDCTLVHGSPYGPLWEYLTSEVLAERSFQHFATRYCFVGHTHVPAIFQQPESIYTIPTVPLSNEEKQSSSQEKSEVDDDDTTELAAIRLQQQPQTAPDTVAAVPDPVQNAVTDVAAAAATAKQQLADDAPKSENASTSLHTIEESLNASALIESEAAALPDEAMVTENNLGEEESATQNEDVQANEENPPDETTPEETIQNAEERLNQEIEELLALLGLSQSMIRVTNEMFAPPEGDWQPLEGYRAIVNPGGVGQPRDGDPRAAFMIYDTERGFTFYRIEYPFEKTQEKIVKAGLPRYLATRLAYGR